jgi:HEAT repeat protein
MTTEPDKISSWIETLDSADKASIRRAVDALIALLPSSPQIATMLKDRINDPQRKTLWPLAYVLAHSPEISRQALPILLHELDSDDPDVRWAIVLLLARLTRADETLLPVILQILAEATPTQRRMIVYYLKELKCRKPVALQALIGLLGDADATVRVATVITLKDYELNEDEKKLLLALFTDDADIRVQHAAAITLATLGAPAETFLSALDRAAHSPHESLKKATAAAQRILQEKREVRPIRRLTSPTRRTSVD